MLVEPDTFAFEMAKQWEGDLSEDGFPMVASDALREGWADMALTFNRHIAGAIKNQWSILQLPTGTGKTQGLALYCSMLPTNKHPGVLIVTNLTEEAKLLADRINYLSGKPKIALACHHENKAKVEKTLFSTPVIIITHVAYKMAWHEAERDELYNNWQNGKRKLTVIDEAMDIIEHAKVTIEDLRFIKAIIPQKVADKWPNEMLVIDKSSEIITRLIENKEEKESYELYRFDDDSFPTEWNFENLISEIEKSFPDDFVPGQYDEEIKKILRKNLIGKCKKVLSNLRKVVSDWCISSRSGNYNFLSTARFILPTDIKSAVVLDATVSENPISIMLKASETLIIRKPPKRIKSYANVNLYVSYDHNVSKGHLQVENKEHFYAMLDGILPRIANREKTLVCVHEDNESHFEELDQNKFRTAHWYAINGINNFRNFDTVVIYGLPYLGTAISGSALIAFLHWLHKMEGTEFMGENVAETIKKHAKDYELRHIIVSIVQAINRAHCRRITEIVNGKGHCPQTDVYLYLNKKDTKAGQPSDGEKIIRAIKRLMPDVNVIPWDAPKLDKKEKDTNFSANEKAIIEFFDAANHDEYEFELVREKTGLSIRDMQRHAPLLNRKKGDTLLSLRLPQVTYYSKKGPGARKYFKKIANK